MGDEVHVANLVIAQLLYCSTFKENQGNNGIFTVAYAPVSFNGTTKFIGSRGTDSLKVGSWQWWHHGGGGGGGVVHVVHMHPVQ